MSVLESVAYPAEWTRVPLGVIAPRVSEVGYGALEPLSVFLNEGVVPRSSRDDNHNQLGSDLEKYQRVLPGDLVFNKLRTWQGGFGVSAHVGVVSPAYLIGRPTGSVVPRYLHHFMRSEPVLAELTRLSKWMPPSQFDIGWDDIRNVVIALPPLDEQRRIADFLDDQVARIDAAVELRKQQQERVESLRVAALLAHFDSARMTSLRRLLREAVVGIVVQPAALYTDSPDGVPALRGTDVSEGVVSRTDPVRLTPEGHTLHPRSRLMQGDVVVVRTGDAGAAAVVPAWAVGWNCIDLVIARCNPELILPEYAEASINAARHGETVAAGSSGSIQQHFGVGALLDLKIAPRSIEDQRLVIRQVQADRVQARVQREALTRSIDLLNEYKRSLITAAVTGELDVTTARTGVPA